MSTNPAILAGGGLLLGLAGGYLLHLMTTDPVAVVMKETEQIKREISDEDLANLCSEPIAEGKNDLQTAQSKVAQLEDELNSKKSELMELQRQAALDDAADEAERKANESARAEAARVWKSMEEEIATLEINLADAVQERDHLKEELRVTIYKLDQQIVETNKAKKEAAYFKSESTANLWSSFLAEAKVEICDRGTRKRHEKCHDAVESSLPKDVRDRFVECVNTYQSTPMLVQGEKDTSLPPYGEWLNQDDRFTKKGWYVQFCDPTLPEADHLTPG